MPIASVSDWHITALALTSPTLGKAGYAQVAMINFLEKLRSQRSVPTFLSTHPATGDV